MRAVLAQFLVRSFSNKALTALCLSACILVALCSLPAAAAVRYFGDQTYTYHQPDGSTFPVKVYGNDFHAYQETMDGRVIVRDAATGFWCYARLSADGRAFESTGIAVVSQAKSLDDGAIEATQAGVMPKLRLPADAVMEQVHAAQTARRVDDKGRPLRPGAAKAGAAGPLAAPPEQTTTGSHVGLCILVDFSDQVGTIPRANIDAFFNQVSPRYTGYGNACSVREYFRVQSGGLLDYTNVVVGYVRVNRPKSYYDDNTDTGKAQQLVSDALDKLMLQGFDFTQLTRDVYNYIECINIFYAGTCASDWSMGLWPHSGGISPKLVDSANGIYAFAYQMTDIKTTPKIGTVCHENGHLLCWFPDLYSYNGNPADLAFYSLMDSGNYGDGGFHPTNVDPYLKAAAGWATVVDLTLEDCLTASLEVTTNTFYRYLNPADPEEYFMFEARGNAGYEGPYGGSSASVNPTSGVVVYHALETGSNTHSSIRNVATPDFSVPYELLLVESHPYGIGDLWYLVPSPGTNDSFFSSSQGGVDFLDANTTPALRFWADDGRTLESLLRVFSVSAIGSSMTFDTGLPAGEFLIQISPPAAAAAGAQWSLDNVTWHNSGEPLTDVAPGSYTVSFSEPSGWTKPADQPVTIGGTCGAAIVGMYTETAISLPVALNAPSLTWSTTGNALWSGRPSVSHDNHAAAQSGAIGSNSTTTLAVVINGPGALSFWWKVSSEADYDFLRFSVDGIDVGQISGETDWAFVTQSISSGAHTFRWIYSKDEFVASGRDAGWVDEVVYTPQGASTGSLLVTLAPATPVTAGAQWQLDGGSWYNSGATLSNLAAGAHSIAFAPVAGWRTPQGQAITITSGGMAHATGTYTQGGSVTVTIQPPEAVSRGARWRLDAGAWNNSGIMLGGVSSGQHTVTFSGLLGYETPASQIVDIASDDDLELTGEYTFVGELPVVQKPLLFAVLLGTIVWLSWRRLKTRTR